MTDPTVKEMLRELRRDLLFKVWIPFGLMGLALLVTLLVLLINPNVMR